jgi:hypothetical protein
VIIVITRTNIERTVIMMQTIETLLFTATWLFIGAVAALSLF